MGDKEISDPTPEEIAAACEEIRSTWSPQTWETRAVVLPTRWEMPEAVAVEIHN